MLADSLSPISEDELKSAPRGLVPTGGGFVFGNYIKQACVPVLPCDGNCQTNIMSPGFLSFC